MRDDVTLMRPIDSEPPDVRRTKRDSTRSTATALENGRTSLRLTWLLAFLATLTLEISAADGDHPARDVVCTVACELAIVIVLTFLARRFDSLEDTRSISRSQSPLQGAQGEVSMTKWRSIWIIGLASGPFIIEVLVRSVMNTMLPLELLLLAWFRDGVLALAVFAHRTDCQRICCSLSTFLTIFASALSAQLWLHGLVVAFAVAGIWWLMGTYWESLQGRLAATVDSAPSRSWTVALPLIVVSMLLCVPVAATQTHALRGFMPSSGGTDWYSETARNGVGDGDALVAGTENIQSFAPIEDAPFLNSHEPSLYDLFDDSYDEPVKVQKQGRAIALSSEFSSRKKENHLAESKTVGREFSTLRKLSKTRQNKIDNRDSKALFYVKGRVPLHLKLEVFDRYDGIDWLPEALAARNPSLSIQALSGKPWLRLPVTHALEIYGMPETHALKIVWLDTNRIPAPTQFMGLHIDKVDRADLFEWAQPGILRMDREKLPPLCVMQMQSCVVDERRIPNAFVHLSGGLPAYREFGDDDRSRELQELARQWTKSDAKGWQQVKSVVDHLRRDYAHDRDVRPPADCDHTVSHFLFDRHRGPDYQFASAAVLLLRSLGYSARLVSGFYVEPSRYDSRSRHTAVMTDDVHFWAEVYAGSDNWLPIEPTPGYELLQPVATFSELLLAAAMASWRWIGANIAVIVPIVSALIWLLVQRHFVADRLATAIWRWRPACSDRAFVRQTLRLLDQRCHWMGRPRPRGVTSTRWLARLASCQNHAERRTVVEFTQLAEWADFGPADIAVPVIQWHQVCRTAEMIWSRKRIKSAAETSRAASRHSVESIWFVHESLGC